MNKLKKILFSKYFIIISSALLSGLLCCIFFAINGIYPGSSKTLLNSDMLYQYVSFYNSLKSIVNGENSIFYNWSLYLGENYIGQFAYYLSSPLSWLILFWKTEDLPIAIYTISLIKILLCGATFSVFLVFRPQNRSIFEGKRSFLQFSIIFFSLCYSLMQYNMMYIICPMWIDSVIILPLVILGLEILISDNKSILYFITLWMALVFNFYTAYMIAIFSIIYFLYYYICYSKIPGGKGFGRILRKYIFNSILGCGAALFILLPTLYSLLQGKVDYNYQSFDSIFTHNIFLILFRFVNTSYDSIKSDGLPCVFCGSFCFILAVFYIIREKKLARKIASISVILIMILSLWVTFLNRVWHMFSDPVCFPFRYSFLLSFFVIMLGFEGLKEFYTFLKKSKISKYKYVILYVFCFVTIIELFFSTSNCRNGQIIETEMRTSNQWSLSSSGYNDLISKVENIENEDISESDYRISSNVKVTENDPMLYDYKGIASFSSVFLGEEISLFKKLGFRQMSPELFCNGGTLITNSLLSVKYLFQNYNTEDFYENVYSNSYNEIYYNKYSLSLGFSILSQDSDAEIVFNGNVFDYQNDILNYFTNDNNEFFKDIDYYYDYYTYDDIVSSLSDKDQKTYITQLKDIDNVKNLHVTFQVNEDGYVYMYDDFVVPEEENKLDYYVYNQYKEIFVNGQILDRFDYGGLGNIINLGYFEVGDYVDLIITNSLEGDKVYLAVFDEKKCIEELESLKNNPSFENIHISNGNLTANIDMEEDGKLFLSIPYDKGWLIYIDGVKTDYYKCIDAFMSIDVPAGNHIIKMIYVSPWFYFGLIISILCVMVKFIEEIIILRLKKS